MSDFRPLLASESVPGRRSYQEDAVLAETLPDGRSLLAVADGMGGHVAGEVASGLAIETLRRAVREGLSLADAMHRSNARVNVEAREPGRHGMGTTLVAALVGRDSFEVGNVGDSRCYLLTPAGIRPLTEDHSYVAEAVRRGHSEEEALASQWREALTRCIGMKAEVEVDVFGPFPVEEGSALLLCSDGLYKALTDEAVHAVYLESGGPEPAARALASAAFDEGSDDNISVVIGAFGAVPGEDRSEGPLFDADTLGPGEVEAGSLGGDTDAWDDEAVGSGAKKPPWWRRRWMG